jgi:hypothetical protein
VFQSVHTSWDAEASDTESSLTVAETLTGKRLKGQQLDMMNAQALLFLLILCTPYMKKSEEAITV